MTINRLFRISQSQINGKHHFSACVPFSGIFTFKVYILSLTAPTIFIGAYCRPCSSMGSMRWGKVYIRWMVCGVSCEIIIHGELHVHKIHPLQYSICILRNSSAQCDGGTKEEKSSYTQSTLHHRWMLIYRSEGWKWNNLGKWVNLTMIAHYYWMKNRKRVTVYGVMCNATMVYNLQKFLYIMHFVWLILWETSLIIFRWYSSSMNRSSHSI